MLNQTRNTRPWTQLARLLHLACLGAWAGLALLSGGCTADNSLVLALRTTQGAKIKSYLVEVQDQKTHQLVTTTGVRQLEEARDLAAQPLRVGLQFNHSGTYFIHVRAASIPGLESLPKSSREMSNEPEFFYAAIQQVQGVIELDAPLLPVLPAFDRDRDHFPDAITWLASSSEAQTVYQGKPELLDCVDLQPIPGDLIPGSLRADGINPLAKALCNVRLRAAGPTPSEPGPLMELDVTCAGQPQTCLDADGDGDPAETDCDDTDPRRFHGNPRPQNCCTCTDPTSCAGNVCTDTKSCAESPALLADKSVCQPSRCGLSFDFDCTGQTVECFIDDDCDGYAANAPDPKKRDCDDHDTRVHPNAEVICDPSPEDAGKDWACDGNPRKGCVPCDLDGDGFQRKDTGARAQCPSPPYVASYRMRFGVDPPADCSDDDRGVFPGSSVFFDSRTIVPAPRMASKLDSKTFSTYYAALRGLCRNATLQGTWQNPDCDARQHDTLCPPADCDKDGDGYPSLATPACAERYRDLPADQIDCQDDPTKNAEAAHIFPGAPERCLRVSDRYRDYNCDNKDDTCVADQDGDGYDNRSDCDDRDPDAYPFAPEKCDGRDNDCDGLVDEMNPDNVGKPMVEGPTGQSYTLSCNDSNQGVCADKSPGAGFTGRCVCTVWYPESMNKSQLNAGALDRYKAGVEAGTPAAGQPLNPLGRVFCPGEGSPPSNPTESSLLPRPRCFGAYQPSPQTCDATKNVDDDCNGSTSDVNGDNLREKLLSTTCGVKFAECIAGKVIGCDRRDPNKAANPFDTSLGWNVPGYDPKTKYYVCDNGTVGPQTEKCNGKDDDCDGKLPGDGVSNPPANDETDADNDHYLRCSGCVVAQMGKSRRDGQPLLGCVDCDDSDRTSYPDPNAQELCDAKNNRCKAGYVATSDDGQDDCKVGAASSCCANIPMCVDLQTNFSYCGTCNIACSTRLSNVCTAGKCKCKNDNACDPAAVKKVCKPDSGCVECVDSGDCKDPVKVNCSNVNTCVECRDRGDCKTAARPACTNVNSCVQCVVDNDCTTVVGKPRCKGDNSCVQCLSSADCTGVPGKPLCNASNTCVECLDKTDCGRRGNSCDDFTCHCNGKTACTAGSAAPVCDATLDCVSCLDPSKDCTAHADSCGSTGTCRCGAKAPCDPVVADNCKMGGCFCGNNMSCDPVLSNSCTAGACKCGAASQCNPKVADACTGGVCKCGGGTSCDPVLTNNCTTGKCQCGTLGQPCDVTLSSSCEAGTGTCKCGAGAACNPVLSDKCDGTKCLCGAMVGCDPAIANTCDKGAGVCRCAGGSACSPALSSRCDATDGCRCGANAQCDGVLTDTCEKTSGVCQCGTGAKCDTTVADRCTAGVCKCKDDASCSMTKPYCRAGAGCVQCLLDAQCPDVGKRNCDNTGAAPTFQCQQCTKKVHCDDVTADRCSAGFCKCNADAACSGAKPYCLEGAGCRECLLDTQCTTDPAKPRCDDTRGGSTYTCKQCAEASHCSATTADRCTAGTCMCNADAQCSMTKPFCLAGAGCRECLVDAQCTADPAKPRCDDARGGSTYSCKQCADKTHCSAATADSCVAGTCMCKDDAQCSGAKPHCVAGAGCRECTTNAHCTDPKKPFCDDAGAGGTFTCVQCIGDAQCSTTTADKCTMNKCMCKDDAQCSMTKPYCLAGTGCRECLMDTQCTADPAKPRCDDARGGSTYACKQCADKTHCSALTADTCAAGTCKCKDDAQCNGAKPYCLAGAGCRECLSSADCTDPSKPFCDDAGAGGTYACVQCTKDMQCKGGLDNADRCTMNKCMCKDDAQCKDDKPACNPATGCVECTDDKFCTFDANKKACDKMNKVCVQCSDTVACPAGMTCTDGSCA